jgi:hypothetical protein
MSTNPTTPRIPKLGDIVQFGMETAGSVMGPAQLPPTPYPAIVLTVHDPNDPESLLDIAVIGPFGSGVSIQRSAAYSPTLGDRHVVLD